MMIATILMLSAGVAAAPLEARVTGIDLQRTPGFEPSWYNRVHVELTSATPQRLQLCPEQASVSTERRTDGTLRPVGRYGAHAMTVGSRGGYATTCRQVTLAPGRSQAVTFFVRDVPGRWRGEDRYTFTLQAGERQFRFVGDDAR